MKKYQYILFDLDGTLLNTLPVAAKAYKETLAEYGQTASDKEIAQKLFGDWQGAKKFGIENVEDFNQRYLKKIEEKYQFASFMKGALALLKKLKQAGKKMALITTGYKRTIDPVLKKNDLENIFDLIITADTPVPQKPNPEIIWYALENLKGVKEETIMIGDSKSDLKAALSAGTDSLLFYPEFHAVFYNEDDLKKWKPTFTVGDYQAVEEIVLA